MSFSRLTGTYSTLSYVTSREIQRPWEGCRGTSYIRGVPSTLKGVGEVQRSGKSFLALPSSLSQYGFGTVPNQFLDSALPVHVDVSPSGHLLVTYRFLYLIRGPPSRHASFWSGVLGQPQKFVEIGEPDTRFQSPSH